MKTCLSIPVFACGLLASATYGQVVYSEGFNDGPAGWTATGGGEVQPVGGNPGGFMWIPYADWYWAELRTEAVPAMTGDLSRYGGALEFGVDIRVFQLNNWFNEPMDPSWFPVVFQFVHATEPGVSVYWTGPGMPAIENEWVRYSIQIPDPTSATLPPGWGGTGDEDPVTYMPILPPGMTFAQVMANVGEVRVTTAQPGYMYVPSFWEAGYDNVELSVAAGGGCYANCDGSTAAPILNVADFTCFLTKFAAGDNYANCDGSTTPPVLNVADFTCFLSKFAAGCE
jgi:hypothetical protein